MRWPPWSRGSRRARRLAPRLTAPSPNPHPSLQLRPQPRPQPRPQLPAPTPRPPTPNPHPPPRAGAPRRRRALLLRRAGRRADRDQVAAALLPARAVAPRRGAGPTPPHARRAARRAGRQEGLEDIRGDELAAAQRARAPRGHVRDERRPRAPRPPRAGRARVASLVCPPREQVAAHHAPGSVGGLASGPETAARTRTSNGLCSIDTILYDFLPPAPVRVFNPWRASWRSARLLPRLSPR